MALYLDPGEGRDLGACGDEDVLSVDDLLAAVFCYGRHLVFASYPPKTVNMGHLRRVMSHRERHSQRFRFLMVMRENDE